EGGDVVIGELGAVRLEALVGEDPAVDARVEGLDAAVEHLGEAGDRLDLGDGDPGLADGAPRGAGGDDLDPGLGEGAGEVDDAGLVEDGEEGSADRAAVCGAHVACSCSDLLLRAPRRSMPTRSLPGGPPPSPVVCPHSIGGGAGGAVSAGGR